jgi:hypothetical protein
MALERAAEPGRRVEQLTDAGPNFGGSTLVNEGRQRRVHGVLHFEE